jgi:hypothetical protein
MTTTGFFRAVPAAFFLVGSAGFFLAGAAGFFAFAMACSKKARIYQKPPN